MSWKVIVPVILLATATGAAISGIAAYKLTDAAIYRINGDILIYQDQGEWALQTRKK